MKKFIKKLLFKIRFWYMYLYWEWMYRDFQTEMALYCINDARRTEEAYKIYKENNMVKVDLRDPNLVENVKSVECLRELGYYTDNQIQKLYDDQLKKDKEANS